MKLYRHYAVQDKTETYPLDPNHTHFILLDDRCGEDDDNWKKTGHRVRSDLIIQMRAEIERQCGYDSHSRQSNEYNCFL